MNGSANGKSRVLIIIPAFNEEKNINAVIESVYQQDSSLDILVINDGSTDKTQLEAEKSGLAHVVNLPVNLGIGGGVQTGFKYAFYHDYDIAIQFDGDGQHLASELDKLIQPILNDSCDVCIGSRFVKKTDGFQSTFTRRIGIKVFEVLNSLLIGQKITDNTSGLRAYNKAAIQFLSKTYPTDYPEPEAVVLLGKNDFRMTEVSVKMQERAGGVSSISGLKSIYYMVKVILAVVMSASRQKTRVV